MVLSVFVSDLSVNSVCVVGSCAHSTGVIARVAFATGAGAAATIHSRHREDGCGSALAGGRPGQISQAADVHGVPHCQERGTRKFPYASMLYCSTGSFSFVYLIALELPRVRIPAIWARRRLESIRC